MGNVLASQLILWAIIAGSFGLAYTASKTRTYRTQLGAHLVSLLRDRLNR